MRPSWMVRMSTGLLGSFVGLILAQPCVAQNNSIMRTMQQNRPLSMADGNLIRTLPLEPRQFRIRDKVSVRVDELARTQAEGEMERRKNASYNAILQDWVRLNGLRRFEKTQADGVDPQVQGSVTELYRAESELDTVERLTLNIAAQVVDLRPNGHLVLEAQKEIRINNELWVVTLSGVCRQEDIGPDNVLLSRDIINLKVRKEEKGHVRDGYRRGFLLRFLDQINPF